MDKDENPIGIFNDFLRATLENEERAHAMLQEIETALQFEITADQKHVFAVAQCLSIAEWPDGKKMPRLFEHAMQRHDLREVMNFLTECGAIMLANNSQGHEVLYALIDDISLKCNALLDQVRDGKKQ